VVMNVAVAVSLSLLTSVSIAPHPWHLKGSCTVSIPKEVIPSWTE
jgi:hypothetical protein